MARPRGRGQRRPPRKVEPTPVAWDPKTKLGKLIRSGQITKMTDALKSGRSSYPRTRNC